MAASDALGPNPIYVEVGGNIGTCVMEMLLATDAHVVVFEPLPKNVALLAQALLLNEASLRNWVKLYPIALGGYPRKIIVTRRKNNSANSIVGESGVNTTSTSLLSKSACLSSFDVSAQTLKC